MSESTTKLDLSQFYGTENYYRVSFLPYVLTDGAAYVAQACRCYWFFEEVISSLLAAKSDNDDFVVAVLSPKEEGATITLTDGNENLIATAEIDITDFPFERWPEPEVKFYGAAVDEGMWVFMLPSEY